MTVRTRFAPSPTGYLHIGGARTALFNYLFARHHKGTYLLRIEDTDRERSTREAVDQILESLAWLGLSPDEPPVFQAAREARHAEIAQALLAMGKAYRCWATPEELAEMREKAVAEGRPPRYDRRWRDRDPGPEQEGKPFAIRIKAPIEGETVVKDLVQGEVRVANAELDDMIILRSDGTPTYLHAVVVDDHDMDITHVIRGDDHLTNAARQIQIYQAMGWDIPVFAHIPLIHGPDGKKLSKRHGAVGLHEYAAMGYPAAAMRNYLARLGWSHGDDELFDDAQAMAWFDLDGIGKAPARLDFKKLEHVSGWHIARMGDAELLEEIAAFRTATGAPPLSQTQTARLLPALEALKAKAKTLPALLDQAHFALIDRPVAVEEKAAAALDTVSRGILTELTAAVQNASWDRNELEAAVKRIGESHGLGLGKVAAPLRAALAGRSSTPSVFDMMLALGRGETVARLQDQAG